VGGDHLTASKAHLHGLGVEKSDRGGKCQSSMLDSMPGPPLSV
jgi:hypothetical protein